WRNLLKRAPLLHFLPIRFKPVAMGRCPLLDEATSGLGIDVSGYHLAIEIKLRLLTLVLGMEVRRLMLPVEHTNHDSKESRDDRHAIKFTATCKTSGEAPITVGRPVAQTAPAQIPACPFRAPGSSEVLVFASGVTKEKE